MKRSASVILFSMLSAVARAEPGSFDLSVGASGRSYPLSAVLEADGGYDLPLWGTPRGPFGGYLRPRLSAATVLTYNSLDAGIEFFPLGILGFRAGAEVVQNDASFPSYDCARNQCRGRFVHPYLGMEATAGFGAFFARLGLRRDHWSLAGGQTVDRGLYANGAFIEPTAGLALNGDGDAQNILHLLLGTKINAQWTALAVLSSTSSDSGGYSRTRLAVVTYNGGEGGEGEWTIGGGLGTFESSAKPLGATATFFARWEIRPSLALR